MRSRLVFALFSSLFAACVLEPVSLENRRCDESHACVTGWTCKDGTCVACTDEDGDGAMGKACRGNDCDDTDPHVGPGNPEICDNGKDDDCDGRKDGEDEDCRCIDNEERPCGTCPGATHLCENGVFGACHVPEEVCDGEDNDCSGHADDGPGMACARGATEACETSCKTPGKRTCGAGCQWGACVADEICNGEDDDCDGARDEGFACVAATTLPCRTSCGTLGNATCSATCAVGACTPPAETCNGQDDDCNGKPDDGAGMVCARGIADANAPTCTTTCGSTGRRACDDACSGYTGACVAPAETCNDLDDDCDGLRDEGLRSAVGPVSTGAAMASVAVSAAPDSLVAFATAGAAGPVSVAAGRGTALDVPSSLSRLVVGAAGGHPRDVEVAVGASGIAVVWIDEGASSEVRLAIASRDASAVVRPEFPLGTASAGARARVAAVPGAGYVVTFIQGGHFEWLLVTEDGTRGTVHDLTPAAPAALKFVSVAATADGRVALGFAVDSGGGALRAQVAFVNPAAGTADPAQDVDWAGSALLRDDGVELAGSDGITAAFAVVEGSGTSAVRRVLAAAVQPGQAAHATPVSPTGAAVQGLVRVAAQPGGALVAWTEHDASGYPAIASAAIFGSAAPRMHRVDEASPTYAPREASGARVAFDGASYRLAWIDVDVPATRRLCP